MGLCDHGLEVAHLPAGPGILQQHTEDPPVSFPYQLGELALGVADLDLDAERPGARFEHRERLGMAVAVREEHRRVAVGDAPRHGHGLGRRRGLIQERGVRDLHTAQVDDHLLEVQKRLEPALADLGLVGGISRVPARILQDIAPDHRRDDGTVIAHAQHRDEHPVAVAHAAQIAERLTLALGLGERERLGDADRCGYRLLDEGL